MVFRDVDKITNDPKLLECLFGHHDYSDEVTMDKDGDPVFLCKVCKRSGYEKQNGFEVWHDYDGEGNIVHSKWWNGIEYWYNKEGRNVRMRYVRGEECWLDNNEKWVSEKPENWKYEK